MGKKKKKGKNRGSKMGVTFMSAPITKVPWRGIANMAFAGNQRNTFYTTTIELLPANLDSRITDMYQNFTKWRLTNLRMTLYSAGSFVVTTVLAPMMNTGEVYLCYTPLDVTYFTVPTSSAQLLDFPRVQYGTTENRLTMKINRNEIRGPSSYEWLETSTHGSIPQLQRSAGTIIFGFILRDNSGTGATSVNGQLTLVTEGIVEFRDPALPAVITKKDDITFDFESKEEKKISCHPLLSKK